MKTALLSSFKWFPSSVSAQVIADRSLMSNTWSPHTVNLHFSTLMTWFLTGLLQWVLRALLRAVMPLVFFCTNTFKKGKFRLNERESERKKLKLISVQKSLGKTCLQADWTLLEVADRICMALTPSGLHCYPYFTSVQVTINYPVQANMHIFYFDSNFWNPLS